MSDLSKITAKIRNLLKMTAQNGASEAEAMMAAETASRLMTEYDLSLSDIKDVEDETYDFDARRYGVAHKRRAQKHTAFVFCSGVVAKFCGVKGFFHEKSHSLVYFGATQNTEFAHFLVDMIKNAMELEYRKAEPIIKAQLREKGVDIHGKTIRTSFMRGMALRINDRLRALMEQRQAATAGNQLVVVKNALLDQKWEDQNVKTSGPVQPAKIVLSKTAYEAGEKAANNVQFERPIGGTSNTTKKIA